MSTVYTGSAANVSGSLGATVNAASNTAPIVIGTTANHLYATGDQVSIAGVTGNTAANGTWTIVVLSSTTFSLTSSTGNGAYVSGGTATDNSLTPQFTIPSDGDAPTAASVNVAMQTLADRTQYLSARVARTIVVNPTRRSVWITSASQAPAITQASHTWPAASGGTTDLEGSAPGSLQINRVVTGSASAFGYFFDITDSVLDGATLLSVVINVSSQCVALPAMLPKFGVTRHPLSNPSATDALLSTGGGLVTDSTAVLGTYQSRHNITFTPDQNNVIDRSLYAYSLIYFPEGSTNAVAGSNFNIFQLNFTNARRA